MLTATLARFAGALRREGVRVSLADESDAATALSLIDLLDSQEVRVSLRIALKVPPEAWTIFDRLFEERWIGSRAPDVPTPPPADARRPGGALRWRWDGERVRLDASDPGPNAGEKPSYSAEPVLRRKSFERIGRAEQASAERLLVRLARRLAARRSRRLVPTSGRGLVDLRRSFRDSVATDGDFLRLARRQRALEEPRIILIYDTSGSMDAYTRFHLAFAFALRRAVRRVEIFAFNTSLSRLTDAVPRSATVRSLERLATGVHDWSGGTRIGACLAEFLALHGHRVGSDTTAIMVSDGLDLGETALLAASMRELKRRARTIVWLNPLAGDLRYEPTAAGMRAALPYIDHLVPGHNLESLERLTRLL